MNFPVFLIFYFYRLFLKKGFIYLFIHERERERDAETQETEKKAPCREQHAGLNPRSPGSRPGLKAALNC